jgi:cupin fold WbuC family metalloprotein
MFKIDKIFTDELIVNASKSERRRTNFNFHNEAGDTLQRMLNIMNIDTYVCPHKHTNPDKREAFILLRGKVMAIEFDEHGNITESFILDRENESFGCEIKQRSYHTLICLEDNSVLYEVKDGPYDPHTDKVFAPWAPKEGDPDCQTFNRKLLDSLF